MYMYIYIYIYIYRSEGFALTGYDIPGNVEDGAWMLWESSSVVVVAHPRDERGETRDERRETREERREKREERKEMR